MILEGHPERREPLSYVIGQGEVFLLPNPCTQLHQEVEQGAGQAIALRPRLRGRPAEEAEDSGQFLQDDHPGAIFREHVRMPEPGQVI